MFEEIAHQRSWHTTEEQAHGPRGGNSGRGIPPGVDLDAGYASDDWKNDPEPEPDRASPESGDSTRVHLGQPWRPRLPAQSPGASLAAS
jgi:hypothetical protein